GAVMVVKGGKAEPFARGLDDPKGLAAWGGWLFVADKKRIWRIDRKGKATVFVAAKDFPRPPLFLNDLEGDPLGTLYVSDSGELKGKGGAVFRIRPWGKVETVVDAKSHPGLKMPNGVLLDGVSFLHLVDFGTGHLHRVRLADGETTKVAEGFGG